MKKNMGLADRMLRIFPVVPVLAVAAILIGPGSVIGIILLAAAAVMLVTSLAGVCPLYTLLHVTTCPRKPSHA